MITDTSTFISINNCTLDMIGRIRAWLVERRERKERIEKRMPYLIVAFTAIFQLMLSSYFPSPEWYARKVAEAMERGTGSYNIGKIMMTISDTDCVDGFYYKCWQTPARASIRASLPLL